MSPPTPKRDSGFSLVELMVAVLLTGVLLTLGATAVGSWSRSSQAKGSRDSLIAFLRNAQERSVAEAATYCVTFSSDQHSYTLYKYACDSTGVKAAGPESTQAPGVTVTAPQFVQPDGSVTSRLLFYPRGAATKGSVHVVSSAAGKDYLITVEGLTARVASS